MFYFSMHVVIIKAFPLCLLVFTQDLFLLFLLDLFQCSLFPKSSIPFAFPLPVVSS